MNSPEAIPQYRLVVVGTDGSPSADQAVDHAARMVMAQGARLVVVTAYSEDAEIPPDAADAPSDIQWSTTLAGQAEGLARRGADRAGQLGADVLSVRSQMGEPASVILDVAEELDADLIVVGSKGMTSPSRFLLGSVPNAISHHAACDVLIVRTD
ncbi:MAG: universal stress protein [Acidimicrobiales bacterium]